jgi:ribosome-associated protein
MAVEVPIRGESIRLGQLLKLAGVVDSGGDAKLLLEHEPVLVNGSPESRRGRRLRAGDSVRIGASELLLTAAGAAGERPG